MFCFPYLFPDELQIGGYIPLERPSCSVDTMDQQPTHEKIVYSDDDIQNHSSSDDANGIQNNSSSDDSDSISARKKLLKRRTPWEPVPSSFHSENPAKKKKYSVWSDIMQADEIENQFVASNFFEDGRGNESYNYRMKYYSNTSSNPYSK